MAEDPPKELADRAGEPLRAAAETSAAPARGGLHRELSSLGVLILTLSCLSPVFSIYGVGADVLQHAGTGAAGLFLFGILATVVWVMVYAELGSAYPYAGGDYVGVGAILGGGAGFASLAVWAITAGPITALEAKTISVYLSDLTGRDAPNTITVISLLASVGVALFAVRTSTVITGLFLAVEMLAVLTLIIIGLWHPVRGIGIVLTHPMLAGSDGTLIAPAVGALALGAVSAVYATAGGNQAIVFGEELKQPRRVGLLVVIAGLSGAVATALPVIAVCLSARDLGLVLRAPAPFSEFVSSVAGPVAGRALSGSVALAIFNALIVQVMFGARLFYSIGRDDIFPRRLNRMLSSVHAPSGAPRAATILIGIFSLACCFLGTHLLVIFVTGIVTYTLGLVCLAVLVGRWKGTTGQTGWWRTPLYPLAPLLGLIMAIGFCVADLFDPDAGRPSMIILGAIIVLAFWWYHLVLRKRPGGWTPRVIS
jgi:amino acid transporter